MKTSEDCSTVDECLDAISEWVLDEDYEYGYKLEQIHDLVNHAIYVERLEYYLQIKEWVGESFLRHITKIVETGDF